MVYYLRGFCAAVLNAEVTGYPLPTKFWLLLIHIYLLLENYDQFFWKDNVSAWIIGDGSDITGEGFWRTHASLLQGLWETSGSNTTSCSLIMLLGAVHLVR